MEIIGDLLPPGVINIVNGYGIEAGQALATSKRIAKIAFTGSTWWPHISSARLKTSFRPRLSWVASPRTSISLM